MKKSIGIWQLWGFALTSLSGTLLHFAYDWLGGNDIIAFFSAVNESTWEHMKLLFWPSFIFALVECRSFRDQSDFWCIKLRGISLGVLLIPIIFYTYNGAIGTSPDLINISIFFIAAATEYVVEARLFKRKKVPCNKPGLAIFLLCVIALSFVVFTFIPPSLEIFKDPRLRS